jgi:hypothetical protein
MGVKEGGAWVVHFCSKAFRVSHLSSVEGPLLVLTECGEEVAVLPKQNLMTSAQKMMSRSAQTVSSAGDQERRLSQGPMGKVKPRCFMKAE